MRNRLARASLAFVTLAALLLGPLPVASSHADPRDFAIYNVGSAPITEAYVSPSSSINWGSNVLDTAVGIGRSTDITFSYPDPGECVYDIQTVTRDGVENEFDSLNLCETSNVTVTDDDIVAFPSPFTVDPDVGNGQLDFVFYNVGSAPVIGAYLAPSGSDSWGPNIMTSVLQAAWLQDVTPPVTGNCYYDFRADFSTGVYGELDDVDLCHTADITITDQRIFSFVS
jgi:hypothetical protein